MITIQAFTQEQKLNIFSIDPYHLIMFNLINFEYEIAFMDGKAGISFYLERSGIAHRKIGDYIIFLSEQNVSLKKYVNNFSKSSFWYGAQLSVASANIWNFNNGNSASNIGTLGISGKLGYQYIKDSFFLNIYAGEGYAITNDLFGDVKYSDDIQESKIFTIYGLKLGIIY